MLVAFTGVTRALGVRAGALLVGGVVAVHQLTYTVASGGSATHTVDGGRHGYLVALVPALVAVLAMGLGAVVVRLARPCSGRRTIAMPWRVGSLRLVWLAMSAALVVAFVVQEWLEVSLGSGHLADLGQVVPPGCWVVGLVALAVGAVLALGLRAVTAEPARCAESRLRVRLIAPAPFLAAATNPPAASVDPLARLLAARAPPSLSA